MVEGRSRRRSGIASRAAPGGLFFAAAWMQGGYRFLQHGTHRRACRNNVLIQFSIQAFAGQDLTDDHSPYVGKGEARTQIDGPHVWLSTNTAQAIAMTLHELATNAAKYGSLSVPQGHLCVEWSRVVDGHLTLHWTESGALPATKPAREGFGMSVIKRMIHRDGEINFHWRVEGLACEIVLQTSKR